MSAGMWVARQFVCWLTAASVATGVCLAENMPTGYFHGTMVSFTGSPVEGVLTASAADGAHFECGYDNKSYLELAKRRVTAAKLIAGDRLELLVDRSGRARSCYIRMLSVLPPQSARSARAPKAQPQPQRPVARSLTPRATFTISGVVVRNEKGLITVRSRDREETMFVRRDTRFVGDGLRLDPTAVGVNQRVFVEAGRDIDGNLEAYQVTWGGIVNVP